MDLGIQHSSLVTCHSAVCCDQPLAANVALEILQKGGNATDAAVAMMCAVSILQPFHMGLGGDAQCLFYRASDKTVQAINGSGKSSIEATMEKAQDAGIKNADDPQFDSHGLWVLVPGSVSAFHNIVQRFGSGKVTMQQILDPVVRLCEEGAPIPRKAAALWQKYGHRIMASRNASDLLLGGSLPKAGDVIFNQKLAGTLKDIAKDGPESFYKGERAQHIVNEVRNAGGVLSLQDMSDYLENSPSAKPWGTLYVDFRGFRVWEMKPNPTGVVLLVALNVLQTYDLKELGHNSVEYIHLLAEVLKYSFLESWDYLCDPEYSKAPSENLLSIEISEKIRHQIDSERCSHYPIPMMGGNTSYGCVVDSEGNGCSLICSVSSAFGSGLIPKDCGFVLQDRGKCMSFEEDSPNVFGPKKFSLHTIIPSMVTDAESGELVAVMGVMGRFMQPQGQLQVLMNMIVFEMDPQTALNQLRFFVGESDVYTEYKGSLLPTPAKLCLEAGIDPCTFKALQTKGHDCRYIPDSDHGTLGRGHVIARQRLFADTSPGQAVWWSGADPRSDGCAAGY